MGVGSGVARERVEALLPIVTLEAEMEIEEVVRGEGRTRAPLPELSRKMPDLLGAPGLAQERTDGGAGVMEGRDVAQWAPEAVGTGPIGGTGAYRHVDGPQPDRSASRAFGLDRGHAPWIGAPPTLLEAR